MKDQKLVSFNVAPSYISRVHLTPCYLCLPHPFTAFLSELDSATVISGISAWRLKLFLQLRKNSKDLEASLKKIKPNFLPWREPQDPLKT